MGKASEALSKAVSRDEKLQRLEALQLICISSSVSALYMLHLLLLFHRVELNIVSREIVVADRSTKSQKIAPTAEVLQNFVESDAHLLGDGMPGICSAVRDAVKNRWAADRHQPMTKISSEELKSFLGRICSDVSRLVLEDQNGPSTILPRSLDQSLTPRKGPAVQKLLDETRSHLAGPDFVRTFRSVLDSALQHFVDLLGEDCDENSVPPLPFGTSAPIAKLGGDFVRLSKLMLEDRAGFIENFAEDKMVAELCERLYFQQP